MVVDASESSMRTENASTCFSFTHLGRISIRVALIRHYQLTESSQFRLYFTSLHFRSSMSNTHSIFVVGELRVRLILFQCWQRALGTKFTCLNTQYDASTVY